MEKETCKELNKRPIETGHKTFDQQTNFIGTGNVFANTQVSYFILAESLEHGLDFWKRMRLPEHIQKKIRECAATGVDVILYQFHSSCKGNRTVHGYILTDAGHNLIQKYITGPTNKSWDVIEVASRYVVN